MPELPRDEHDVEPLGDQQRCERVAAVCKTGFR